MRRFSEDVIYGEIQNLALQLQRAIEKRESGSPKEKMSLSRSGLPPPILTKNFNFKRMRLFDIDPLEIARQLTMIEFTEFGKITFSEFLDKAWSNKNLPSGPNIKNMIKLSNKVTNWISMVILRERDVKKRAIILKYFIILGEV